jgi:cytoplasmic tRNA 2-thiolation protein 2
LNEQLQRQLEKNNRLSYELTVAYVDLNFDSAEASAQAQSHWEKVQETYSSHKYIKVGIEDALDLDTIKWSSLGLDTTLSDKSIPKKDRLQTLLKSIPAATSRADISTTLLSSLLVDVAKGNSCDSILFGDSTTRLAEKTLTETAKGRGFSLPWQVSDGESPFGVHYRYPLRDILKKELVSFAALTSPPLTDLIIPTAPMSALVVSSKNTTIDDLMTQYFESVEENYPSIVANVVRTSSKLKAPSVDDTTRCSLCGVPVASGTEGIHGWGGDQSFNAAPLPSSESSKHGILCYGCSRSING